MDTYKIHAEPDWDTITVTGGTFEPFKMVPGASITDTQAILPFSPETADILFTFLRGKDVSMSLQTKRYLRVLKDREHVGKKGWIWSLDLYKLKDVVINQKSKQLHSQWDLIHYMPLRYVDKSNPQNITDLELDTWAVVVGEIVSLTYNGRADATILVLKDITGATISSWFFRQRWLLNRFQVGETVVLSGTYTTYTNKRSGASETRITNATLDKVEQYDSGHKVAPVYSEKAGKKKYSILDDVEKLLSNIGWIEDPVPDSILEKYGFMTRNEAYRKIHFPDSIQEAYDARQRIAFDDFVRLQVFLKNKKDNEQNLLRGNPMELGNWAEQFVNSLPFNFTGAQHRVKQEISDDMMQERPMRRLLHGDVGSGKAQPLYSKVLTPTGFTTIGDIKVGDTVLAPEGSSTHVTGIYPQGERPVYKLLFDDGSVVHADENHLWLAQNNITDEPVLRRTHEIRDSLHDSQGMYQWHIISPDIKGLGSQWEEALSPKLTGMLLGAGALNQRTQTIFFESDELSVQDFIQDFTDDSTSYEQLKVRLRQSNHPYQPVNMPEALIGADGASRRMLLKGFIETGGEYDNFGTFTFDSPSPETKAAVTDLTRSLGSLMTNHFPSLHGIFPPEEGPLRFFRTVVEVEYIGVTETQCIKLADPNGLYITDDFMVTHNTELATTAILRAIESGKQAAVLAPTSILASQLQERFERDLKQAGLDVTAGLFVNGLRVKQKRELLEQVANGDINLLVGTHSILNKDVVFQDLGLIVIDEQHKFGTEHRQSLASNFLQKSEIAPDTLMMSATPIPRTMAQTIFGDMDISVVDEYPADRKPVITYWDEDDTNAWEAIRDEVQKGHQAYVIASLVEQSESEKMENVENATETHTYLQSSIFPDLNVGLVHGKMKPAEKEAVLQSFYNNETQVLVSTSVIEVGVNVPNSTVMVILNANRFGIASLHQIRGRVGRGGAQGYCYLIGEATNPDAEERLNALVISNDGFWLAEKDLEIRGEGSLLKGSQHGQNDLIVGNLREHRKLLEVARRVADPASKSVKLQKEVEHLFGEGEIKG